MITFTSFKQFMKQGPMVSALSGTLLADCGVLLQLVWTPEWPDFVSTMGGLSFCIWACRFCRFGSMNQCYRKTTPSHNFDTLVFNDIVGIITV